MWSCSWWCEILCWEWLELIMFVLVVVFFRRKIVNFTGEGSWECKPHDEAQADDWPRNQSGIIQQYSEWRCYSFQDWHRRWQVVCSRWIPWHFKKHNVQNAVVEVRNYNVWDFQSHLEAVGNFTHVYNYLEYDRSMDLATFTQQQPTLPDCPWHHSQQKIWKWGLLVQQGTTPFPQCLKLLLLSLFPSMHSNLDSTFPNFLVGQFAFLHMY